MQYVTEVFDQAGKLDKLKGFVADYGRKFYGLEVDPKEGKIVMVKRGVRVKETIGGTDGVVPFRAGEKLLWDLIWVDS